MNLSSKINHSIWTGVKNPVLSSPSAQVAPTQVVSSQVPVVQTTPTQPVLTQAFSAQVVPTQAVSVVQTPPAQTTSVQDQLPAQEPTAIQSDSLIQLTGAQKLDIFSQVLDEIEASQSSEDVQSMSSTPSEDAQLTDATKSSENVQPADATESHYSFEPSVIDQALPQFLAQSADAIEQSHISSSPKKETIEGSSIVVSTPEVSSHGQAEVEKSAEITPEVESYLQKVDDHASDIVHEIVIADGTQEQSDVVYPSQPVIVLPIDEAIEKKARFKSAKYSIRWLVEWSHKIIKMFAGKVIYRTNDC